MAPGEPKYVKSTVLNLEWLSVYIVGPEQKLMMIALEHLYKMHSTYLTVTLKVNTLPQKLTLQILNGCCHNVRVSIKQNRVLTAFLFIGLWHKPPFWGGVYHWTSKQTSIFDIKGPLNK